MTTCEEMPRNIGGENKLCLFGLETAKDTS